jgi:hypothetical protein
MILVTVYVDCYVIGDLVVFHHILGRSIRVKEQYISSI